MKVADPSTFDLSALPFSVPGHFYKGNLHTHCTSRTATILPGR